MTISRDSWLLTLTLVASVALWLSSLAAPWEWTWQQWMGNVAVAIGMIVAKLSSYPDFMATKQDVKDKEEGSDPNRP
jgi:hypothetical protein